MGPKNVDKKIEYILMHLEDAQTMFMELMGEKSSRLSGFPQSNIDKLIQDINDDFLQPAIDSIKGEF